MSAVSADHLSPEVEAALAEVVDALIAVKRALGFHYAWWCIRAPTVEAAIALVGMAQEELGHAGVLGGAVRDTAADKEAVVTWKAWGADTAIEAWEDMVVVSLAREQACVATLELLRDSTYARLVQRIPKMLQEESFHCIFGMETIRAFTALSADDKAKLAGRYRDTLRASVPPAGALERLAAQGVLPVDAVRRLEGALERASAQTTDALK